MRFSNERGSLALGGLVGLFIILGALYLYFHGRIETSRALRNRHYFKAHLESLITSMNASLISQKGYMNTIRSPLNKVGADLESCLNNPAFDCPRGTYPLSIVKEDGTALIDNSNTSNGWNVVLKPCSTFYSTLTNCVIKYELLWTPRCPPAGPCLNPEIDVAATVRFPTSADPEVIFLTTSFNSTFTLR